MTDAPNGLQAALAERYRIERELGAGGMATVYLARFVGVAGFALDVPGVPDYQARYWKTNGVKVIGGTGDVGHRDFNDAARAYANRYNAALLKYLASHRSSYAKT